MAVRQYIGARYMPKFVGNYNATQQYEPLDVVDNGEGTSYIAKIPVPPNTPLTKTTYWHIYGSTSGAILHLQDEIDAINSTLAALESDVNKIPKNRKFVLVGDSFGVGIIDSSTPWTTGWEDYFYQLFPGRVAYFNPQSDPSFEGAGGFTTTGQYNFTDQLQHVHDSNMGSIDPAEITDVVVLGGSNEIGTEAQIISAIDTFCTLSRRLFPNADIKLGCVGLYARKFINNHAYGGYSKGAGKNGCAFLGDLLNLGASRTYDSGLGHWTAAGYALFNPYIAECIINGHVNFRFVEAIALTLNNDVTVSGSITFTLEIVRTNDGVYGHILNNTSYGGWWLTNNKTIGQGVHTVTAFKFTGGFYPAVLSGASIDPTCITFNGSTGMIDNAAAKMSLVLDTDGVYNHEIRISSFRRISFSQTADLMYSWNGTFNQKLEDYR